MLSAALRCGDVRRVLVPVPGLQRVSCMELKWGSGAALGAAFGDSPGGQSSALGALHPQHHPHLPHLEDHAQHLFTRVGKMLGMGREPVEKG